MAAAHTFAPGGLAGPVVERSSSILRSIASPAVSDEPSLVLVPLHSFDSHELTLGDETDLSPP